MLRVRILRMYECESAWPQSSAADRDSRLGMLTPNNPQAVGQASLIYRTITADL